MAVLVHRAGSCKFWYVNLQAPIKRTRRGIVVLDYALDIVVRPDMTWSWKDEDELQELHRRGVLTDREVEAARTEGERMIEVIENNGPPFCDGWERWRARPEWPAPASSRRTGIRAEPGRCTRNAVVSGPGNPLSPL